MDVLNFEIFIPAFTHDASIICNEYIFIEKTSVGKQNIHNFRELWRIDDINICIDKLDDGFILGEMEILVQNPSQVSSNQNLYI